MDRLAKTAVLCLFSLAFLTATGLSAQTATNSVSPTQLTYLTYVGGPNPTSQNVTITALSQTTNWTASLVNKAPYVTLSQTSGSGSGTLSVSMTTGSLFAGTFIETLRIAFPGTTNTFDVALRFQVAAQQVSFTGNFGGSNPASQTLSVSTAQQSGNVTWSADVSTSSGGSWLSVSPVSQSSPGSSTQTLTVSANITGLTAGTYRGVITLTNAIFNTATAQTPVVLTISAPPVTLTPTLLTFNASFGTNPASQTVSVNSATSWVGSVTIPNGGKWLSISPASGQANGSFSASVDVTGLNSGSYSASITVTAASGVAVSLPVTLNVAGPQFSVTPQQLTFSMVEGATPPLAQSVSVAATPAATTWSATSVVSGTTLQWLRVSPAAGGFPASGSIAPNGNASSLTAGSYTGTVTFSDPNATPTSVPVAVTLNVAAPPPGNLTLSPTTLSFQTSQGDTPPTGYLTIGNSGGGTLNWTAKAILSNSDQGNWLTITPSGSATVHTPSKFQLSFSPNLPPNSYTAAVTVTAGTQTLAAVITYVVSPPRLPQLVLGSTGLVFNMIAGGPAPQAQTIVIGNNGSADMSYTLSGELFVGGSFVSFSPRTSTIAPKSYEEVSIALPAGTSSLGAGNYYGTLHVQWAAASSPNTRLGNASVSVTLNVASTGSPATVVVYPRAVILTPTSTTASILLTTSSASPTGVLVKFVYASGLFPPLQNVIVPVDTSVKSVLKFNISAAFSELPGGLSTGTVTVVFGDGSPSVDIAVFMIKPNSSAISPQSVRTPGAICTPASLVMAMRQLGSNFSSSVGWPQNIEAQLVDDCGNPVSNGSLSATFSTGDTPLALASIGSGLYGATWNPVTANPATVTLTAIAPGFPAATATVSGTVSANATPPPILSLGGVVNAASFAKNTPLAPGGIISIFGSNLATANTPNGGFPLLTTLGNIKLSMGGIDMPLFFAGPGQVNAQVPAELAANSTTNIVATAFTGTSVTGIGVPVSVSVGANNPGIFLVNAPNTQGVILNNPALQVVDATHPASAGDVLTIYCTGLGATNPLVATGAPSPSGPAATVASPVTVTFGTLAPVATQFAGLTPGLVGLYQVNVAVPAGLSSGAVNVTLNQNGATSNTVTIAIK